MTTANLKLEIEKALKKTQSQAVLELVYSILSGGKINEQKRISRKQYNKEIRQTLNEVKKGKFVTEKDADKRLSKW